LPRKTRRRMVGGKQEDAERHEREQRIKELMREIRQLRLQKEREAEAADHIVDPATEHE